MFVGQVSGPAGAHLVGRGVCRPGQRSAIWHKDRDRAGMDRPAAQRQPTWLMTRQMRYFSLFNSA